MLMMETMGDDDDKGGAAVRGGGLALCERRGAGECMKPRPRIEKPRPAWKNNYSSSSSRSSRSSMALDCLVEVALSPTAALGLHLSGRDNAGESVATLRTPPRPDGQGDEGKDKDDDDDSAAMGRYWSCSSAVKSPEPAAAMAPPPSPGFYQQRQQQQQQQRQEEQKLRRGLSSWTAMSHPAGRSSSSSLRVHTDHPHSKR